jgi:ribosome-associated protein
MVKIDFYKLAFKAAEIAEGKKAKNTIILDVCQLTAITNYFVVTTAETVSHINGIYDDIETVFKKYDIVPIRKEGVSYSKWEIIDYGGLIIHIMCHEVRNLYGLEFIWKDAKVIELKGLKLK